MFEAARSIAWHSCTHQWIIQCVHAGTASSTAPITITIYDPHETPDTYLKTFKDAQHFDKFMVRANIISLFKDGASSAIDQFEGLVPDATYTTAVRSIPARVTNLEQHKQHLVMRREHELASAIIHDLAEEGIVAEELAEERVTKVGTADVAEVDVAVGSVDGSRFVLGSMKTYVSGDGDVRQLAQKVAQYYAPRPPFKGRPIDLAFMAEVVKDEQRGRLLATCKQLGVRLYARNGSSISRVK